MFKTIIWATDGSDGARAALADALALAALTRGRILAVHCDQRMSGRAASWPAIADEQDRRLSIAHKVEALREDGIDIELIVRQSHREAADVVAAVAAELGADVIVCGTRGLGAISGLFLGSFTQRLLHIATCPVLAVPERAAVPVERERKKAEVGA